MKASPYLELANELEITKAITYLKEKDFNKVSNHVDTTSLVSVSCEKFPPRVKLNESRNPAFNFPHRSST